MFRTLLGVLTALACSLPGGAIAKMVIDQAGRYKIELPDDLRILKQGQSRNDGAYRFASSSPKGNLKVFVRAVPYRAPDYDFYRHFKAWERMLLQRGHYRTLRPITPIRQVRGNDRVAYYRVLDGIGARVKTLQPFRIFAMGSHSLAARRIYTVTVAAHTDFFIKNRARIMKIVSSFAPFDVMRERRAHRLLSLRGATAQVRRVSVRGLLARRKGKVVAASKVRGAAQPAARPGAHPHGHFRAAPSSAVRRALSPSRPTKPPVAHTPPKKPVADPKAKAKKTPP
jgi:hypothetical protein